MNVYFNNYQTHIRADLYRTRLELLWQIGFPFSIVRFSFRWYRRQDGNYFSYLFSKFSPFSSYRQEITNGDVWLLFFFGLPSRGKQWYEQQILCDQDCNNSAEIRFPSGCSKNRKNSTFFCTAVNLVFTNGSVCQNRTWTVRNGMEKSLVVKFPI